MAKRTYTMDEGYDKELANAVKELKAYRKQVEKSKNAKKTVKRKK